MTPSAKPVLTPCIGVCTLDEHGLCHGCFRTIDEIARWGLMEDAERAHYLDEVLPDREARRA